MQGVTSSNLVKGTNKNNMKVIKMTDKDRVRLEEIAEKLKDRELFTKQIEYAKKTLSNLKELPSIKK